MNRTRTRVLAGSALTVAFALGVLLWPAALGGSTSFVSTRGSSMEPHLHQHDLVVLKRTARYRTGDVVGYRSPTLGGVTVLHRIVDRDAQGFITKGDNNDHLDPDRPTAATIMGKEWARVPGGGPILGAIKVGLPLISAGLYLFARRKRTTTARRGRPAHLAPPSPSRTDISAVRAWGLATAIGGGLAVLAVVLGLVSFARPASVRASDELAYTQRGTFAYRADAPSGAVYGDGSVDTGEPIFLRMVDELDLTFDYDFESSAAQQLTGTVGVSAVLSNGSGWRHELVLQEAEPFRDDDARTAFRLDLRQVQLLVVAFAAETGLPVSGTRVAVVPEVRVSGSVAGRAIEEAFAPELAFQLDELQLRPVAQGDDRAAALAPSLAGALTSTTDTPRHVGAFGLSLPVATTRALAVGLALPATVVAAAGLVVLRRRLEGEAARIELRHGHRMVPVTGRAERAQIVEVRSIQDLARMAEQYQSLILHREGAYSHDYELPLDGVVYRYTTQDERPPSRLG